MSSIKPSTESITTSNERIISFYRENPHLDFDKINIAIISILEQLGSDITRNLESSMTVEYLKNILDKTKAIEMSQLSITDLIKHNSVSMASLLDKFNHNIIDKLHSLIKEQHTISFSHIQSIMTTQFDATRTSIHHHIDSTLDSKLSSINPIIKQTIDSIITSYFDDIKTSIHTLQDKPAIMDEHIQHITSSIIKSYKNITDNLERNISASISTSYSVLSTDLKTQQGIYEDMTEFLKKQRFNNSQAIGKTGENRLELILNELYPSANIVNTSRMDKAGDFIIIRQGLEHKIMVETKEYTRNVGAEEITKFIRDIEHKHTHGLFLSQSSGISGKKDFELSIHEGNILLFIHNVNYDKRIINTAINIIDMLHERLKDKTETSHINTEMLDIINNEYTNVIKKRNLILDMLKKQHRDIVAEIETIDLSYLSNILKKRYTTSGEHCGIVCDKCGQTFTNRRALGSHNKGCKAKTTTATDSTTSTTSTTASSNPDKNIVINMTMTDFQ
jgi:hypothetical protein